MPTYRNIQCTSADTVATVVWPPEIIYWGALTHNLANIQFANVSNAYVVDISAPSQTTGNATVTFPDLGATSDTFVFASLAQTLTNKTLTSPTLTNPVLGVGGATMSSPDSEDIFIFREDFIGGDNSSGYAGTNGWRQTNVTGSGAWAFIQPVQNHPGILSMQSGATTNDKSVTTIGLQGGSPIYGFNSQAGGWTWTFKLISTASVAIYIGLGSNAGSPPLTTAGFSARIIALGFDSSSDTNFQYVCYNNDGSITRTDSGLAADTNWHTVKCARASATSCTFTIDGAYSVTVSAEVPTLEIAPMAEIKTLTSARKEVYLDYFGIWMQVAR